MYNYYTGSTFRKDTCIGKCKHGSDQKKLDASRKRDKLATDTIDQFIAFIDNASEIELFRASPIRYSETFGIDPLIATNLFLIATHAGILDFSWGTLCPSCGVFIQSDVGLKYIEHEDYCSLCTLPYQTDSDNEVEIAFTISPEIRKIRFHDQEEINMKDDWMNLMFSTSIALYPEVHQILHSSFLDCFEIEKGMSEVIELELEPDHYLFIIPATHATAHVAVTENAQDHHLDLEIQTDGSFLPELSTLGSGLATIKITNNCGHPFKVGLHKDARMAPTPIEKRAFPIAPLYDTNPYLTGKGLITNQTFRDLFPKESVPADQGLEFNDLTFLFTDLKGSTELYDRFGDLKAYAMIGKHFDALREIVAENSGAMVKTMGDAIMASFANPLDAVQAAFSMKTAIGMLEGSEYLELRIGIHNGPSIAINTNEQLDFFGQTVNVTSRIQHAAEPGEIIITQKTFDAPGVKEVLKASGFNLNEETGEFKGVSGEVKYYRMTTV